MRISDGMSKWSEVNVGKHQSYMMSPWLSTILMDEALHEIRVRWGDCGVIFDHEETD